MKEFGVEKGVKQGGVLSPLLFSIFINGLIEELKKDKLGIKVGNVTVKSLSRENTTNVLFEKTLMKNSRNH